MEERIIKSIDNQEFYAFAFILSLITMFFLPMIILVISAGFYSTGSPGYFSIFMTDIKLQEIPEMSSITQNIYVIAEFLSMLILTVLFIIVLKKQLFSKLKEFFSNAGYNIIFIIIWFVLLLGVTYGVAKIFDLLGIEEDPANQLAVEALLATKLGFLMLVSTVFFAPILEELIFRKFMFGLIEKTLKLPLFVAVIISAIVFALIHDYKIFFFMYFPLALVLSLSYAFHKKNVIIPIAVHFLNNALVAISFLLAQNG